MNVNLFVQKLYSMFDEKDTAILDSIWTFHFTLLVSTQMISCFKSEPPHLSSFPLPIPPWWSPFPSTTKLTLKFVAKDVKSLWRMKKYIFFNKLPVFHTFLYTMTLVLLQFKSCSDWSRVHTQGSYPYFSRDKSRVSATRVKGRDKVMV